MQVLLAAKHLSERCIKQSRVAHSAQTDLRSQLRAIGQLISDYQDIIRNAGQGT